MSDHFWGARLALVVIGVAACSGSTSGGTAVSAEQACGDTTTAYCNRVQSCAPFFVQVAFGDVATCIAREKTTCHARVGATGSGATASNLEACAQALATASCTDLFSNNSPSACQIPGTLAAGTACGDDWQCAGSASYCKKAAGTCGVCSVRANGGEACGSEGDCQIGLVCQTTARPTTCVTPGAAGAPCSGTQKCLGTLTCLLNGATTGTCAAQLAAGATCDRASQNCDSYRGLFCVSSVCSQVQVAPSGGACGFTTSSATSCAAGGKCSGALTGTCMATAADGATCDDNNGPPCLLPAVCVNGSCRLPDATSCR